MDPTKIPLERNRFFTGKFMTARDFRAEQEYFLSRHRLHNWSLHGWGIVCGLEVQDHPDPQCQAQGWVVVTPGMAIDCYGREIVLREPTPIHVPTLAPSSVACGCTPKQDEQPAENTPFLIGLQYGEVGVEPVPVLYDSDDCGERTAPNRLREQPCFRFHRYEADKGCWLPRIPKCPTTPPLPGGDSTVACHAKPSCFEPPCPCDGGFVPLRKCTLAKDNNQYYLKDADDTGRRYVFGPLHPYTLTHICHVNWNHGAETNRSELTDKEDPGNSKKHYIRLLLNFDRPLCKDETVLPSSEPEPTTHRLGFFRRIMQVFYVSDNGTLQILPGRGSLSSDRTRLYFDIDECHLHELWKRAGGMSIHVRLNCDFLPDQFGRAVDGNHLRGSLAQHCPTGDGVEGGVFESWFQLVESKEQVA